MYQLHSLLILIIDLFGNQSAEANIRIEEGGSARKLANKWNFFYSSPYTCIVMDDEVKKWVTSGSCDIHVIEEICIEYLVA